MGILVSFFFNRKHPAPPQPPSTISTSRSRSSSGGGHAGPDAEEEEALGRPPRSMTPGQPPPQPTSPYALQLGQEQRTGSPYTGHASQSPRTAESESESEDALHRMTISNVLQDTQPPQTQASPSSVSSFFTTTSRQPQGLGLSSSSSPVPTPNPTAHIPSPASPPPSDFHSTRTPSSEQQQQQQQLQHIQVDTDILTPPPSPGGRQYLPVTSDFTLRLPSFLSSPPPHEVPNPSTQPPTVTMSDADPHSFYPPSPSFSSPAYSPASSSTSSSTSSSGLTPALPPLRIDVAAANDPGMDHEIEMADASFVGMGAGRMAGVSTQAGAGMSMIPEGDEAVMFDEEGLSSLEKIYLFARSEAPFHRVFIARSLINFLPEVDPAEAVDYVIPLMNGLAMDEDETVKEALVEDLVDCIWWFLTVCHVVDYEIPDSAQGAGSGSYEPEPDSGGRWFEEDRIRLPSGEASEAGRAPPLHVPAFTPLLGTLLLNPSASVNTAARYCVVQLLTRLRELERAEEEGALRVDHARHASGQPGQGSAGPGAPASASAPAPNYFGPEKRKLFERELLHQVVIGMAHLQEDNNTSSEQHSRVQSGAEPLRIFHSPPEQTQSQSQTKSLVGLGYGLDQQTQQLAASANDARTEPPLSAAEDATLLSTLTGSALALATQQFLAQEEPQQTSPFISTSPPLTGSESARPPSPIPGIEPSFTPSFAQVIAQGGSRQDIKIDEVVMCDVDTDVGRAPASGPGSIYPSPISQQSAMVPRGNTSGMRISPPLRAALSQEDHRMQISDTPLQTPYPEKFLSEPPMMIDDVDQATPEIEEERLEHYQFSDEQAAVGKLASMSLMAAVTANAPVDPDCHGAFVQEVESAGRDPTYWVRREATFALGALAKVVPEELFYLTLVPLFNDLCEDPVHSVRQSVLFSLPAILSRLPFDRRRTQALRTIQKMSNDPEKVVRTAALEVLGETIYAFHGDSQGPPEELINLFIGEEGVDWHDPESPNFEAYLKSKAQYPFSTNLTRPQSRLATNSFLLSPSHPSTPTPTSETPADPARPLICAFNLPAVALVLGRPRWPQLRKLYAFLARTGTTKVHTTLAASLGELARIVGPEHAHKDLLYRFWDFVRGKEAGVRTKALEALPVLLRELAPAERARLVGDIEEDWEVHLKGWREREKLVQELGGFLDLFPEDGEVLRGIVRRSLRDPTAAVRNAGVAAYPDIYNFLVSQSRYQVLDALKEDVTTLAYDDRYKFRLTYVACMKALLESGIPHDQCLDDTFWHTAVGLSSDQIVDVRIGTARLLSLACDAMLTRKLTLPGGVLNVIRTLSDDPSSDVRAYVSHILSPEAQLLRGRRGFESDVEEGEEQRKARERAALYSMPPKRRERAMANRFEQMKISEDPRVMSIDSPRIPS